MTDSSDYDTGGPHYSSIDISGNTQRCSEDTAFLADQQDAVLCDCPLGTRRNRNTR